MIRNSYNVDISVPGLPQSPKRPAALASRPRSGGSESSFNFDMPKTPHFDQISSVSSAAMNGSFDLPKSLHGSNSSLFRNNLASSHSTASSNHMNFSQPIEPHSYNITNGYPVDLEEEIYVFVEPLNRRLCCPVCSQVFKDPVITTCGHTFCKVCVQKSVNEVCPIDMKPSKYIVDNIALSEQIGELVVRCKYGCKKSTSHPGEYVADESGCPVTLKISERYSHEKHCDFFIMSCPNNRDCPQFLRKDLESHLQTCTYFACPNQKNGCDFVGARHSLSEHIALCSYNSLKGSSEGESCLDKIKQENKSAREDIDFLFTSLRLNQRFEQMEAEKDKMEAEHEKLIDHVNKMASALDEAHKEIIMGKKRKTSDNGIILTM
ncbi:TRAF7 [Bugula neritina]|uniref:TRAF7 n=1 Tax=Bugula neritina TaxID=10212 RepID=A0A7J7JEJ4_BUGNE|nr:TRAF7 [Bugula neritina]